MSAVRVLLGRVITE